MTAMSRKKKHVTQERPVDAPVMANSTAVSRKILIIALGIFIFASGIYLNTIFHDYALDDGIVITNNPFTKKGFAGIGDIFSHETFVNVADLNNELSGGRYRPLSVATFAMEYQFFGLRPSVSHLINVLLYGLLGALLFYFLYHTVFRQQLLSAILATIIFVVHPLHTDVVANIKGRDELLSLILLLASLICCIKYAEKKKFVLLIISLLAYFLSLLAKENGITFLAVIPLMLYFFMHKRWQDAFLSVLPYVFVFVGYFLLRVSITGLPQSNSSELMNAPFANAVGDEAIATKIMVLGKDLWMLIFPHPLSYDYSYNQVPYVHLTDWRCLLAFFVNGALLFVAFRLLKSRHVVSFAILFYFITLSIVSNFVFDVGSPFNERFLFQPSIGFAIAIAFVINYPGNLKPGNKIFSGIAVVVAAMLIIAGATKTILRNPEWKNDDTLFLADVKHAPNSAKTNCYAGIVLIKKGEQETDSIKKNSIFEQAIIYFNKALMIYPQYVDPYINLGNVYAQMGNLDAAKEHLMKAKEIYPGNSALRQNLSYLAGQYEIRASRFYEQKNLAAAILAGHSSVECNPSNINMLYNLGGYYLSLNNRLKAKEFWSKALALDPSNRTIQSWLDKISVPPPSKNE